MIQQSHSRLETQGIESRVSGTLVLTSTITAKGERTPCVCPSPEEWGNKMVRPHTGVSFSLSMEGVLTPAATWVDPEDIVLSATSQSQKDKYCLIPLI